MYKSIPKKFYSRPEIQEAILNFSKNREIGTRFEGYFGKRPEVLEYLTDVKAFVNKGIFSFHASEERWANPLLLGNEKLTEEDKNKNRIGWDLILDLDGVDFEYSKIVAKMILDFFEELKIKNSSIKFSGNKGFHIGVPFEAFSQSIIGIGETRNLFPDAPRRISAYLMHELGPKISNAILNIEGTIESVAKKYNLNKNDLICKDERLKNFNYLKVIEIDTILISSRHLFRMPYSLNEKSGLVSVPISKDKVMKFQRHWGKPDFVKPEYNKNFEFLKYEEKYKKDADVLLIKAYEDDYTEMVAQQIPQRRVEQAFEIKGDVSIKDFPQTISYILKTNFEDGRKRALFVLLCFLYSCKWDKQAIEQIIIEWNEKQEKPLRKNYWGAQISWFEAQDKVISPPNFDNDNYYSGIGIPVDLIKKDEGAFSYKPKVKNPLHYVFVVQQKKKK